MVIHSMAPGPYEWRNRTGLTSPPCVGTCSLMQARLWRGKAVPSLIDLRRNVVLQAHPGGSDGDETCFARCERLALAHRFDPQQRQTEPVAARAHFTDLTPVHRHDSSRWGGRPFDLYGHQSPLDQPAILRPGCQLLADITALVPVDAVQFVEASFEEDRFLQYQVAAAIRNAERQTQPVVAVEAAFDNAGSGQQSPIPFARQNGAGTEHGQPRIDEGDARTERPASPGLAQQTEGGRRVASEYCGTQRWELSSSTALARSPEIDSRRFRSPRPAASASTK